MSDLVGRESTACLLGFLIWIAGPQAARGEGARPPEPAAQTRVEVEGGNRRGIDNAVTAAEGNQPLIGFIDSPTVTCYQPDITEDVCYINWYSISVNAAPAPYINYMKITLVDSGRVIGYYRGFFQSSMTVPHTMHGRGFKVPCGALGAGGDPTLGNKYGWKINAEDSAGLTATNIGTIACPAFIP